MKTPVNKPTFSQRLDKHLFEKGESNDELFKSLSILIDFLGVKTIKEYAIKKGKSAQSVYQYESDKIHILLDRKIIVDNE